MKELQNILNRWKGEEEFHQATKKYEIAKSPVKDGEFIIIVGRRVKINFMNASRLVSVIKKMHTNAQAKDPISDNPQSDIFILSNLLKQIDTKFLLEYANAEDDLIQEVMPDGFF